MGSSLSVEVEATFVLRWGLTRPWAWFEDPGGMPLQTPPLVYMLKYLRSKFLPTCVFTYRT